MPTLTVKEPIVTECIHDALEPTIATGVPPAKTVIEVPNIILGAMCGASPCVDTISPNVAIGIPSTKTPVGLALMIIPVPT